MLPSLSAASPCGPEPGVFNGYSLISPDFGSSRPNLFANWPVYQSAPSGATSGSCGRESGVGTSHSRMTTFRSAAVMEVEKTIRASSPWKKGVRRRCERRGAGCKEPRRSRCRGASGRSGDAADGPAQPQPLGADGLLLTATERGKQQQVGPSRSPQYAKGRTRRPHPFFHGLLGLMEQLLFAKSDPRQTCGKKHAGRARNEAAMAPAVLA